MCVSIHRCCAKSVRCHCTTEEETMKSIPHAPCVAVGDNTDTFNNEKQANRTFCFSLLYNLNMHDVA